MTQQGQWTVIFDLRMTTKIRNIQIRNVKNISIHVIHKKTFLIHRSDIKHFKAGFGNKYDITVGQ